jgi:single-stranded DNA-specific DHH superfamily exonuclease
MSEFALHPQEEIFSLDETLQDLRERAADFMGRLAARAGFTDTEDSTVEETTEIATEAAAFKMTTSSSESHIVYAEEKKEEAKKTGRPPRPHRSPPAAGHDPATCRMTVCSSCNKLGHPK